jgi:hypothetical protein
MRTSPESHLREEHTMRLRFATVLLCLAVFALPLHAATLNEIRVDQTGTDYDEYVELAGQSGESLDGLTFLVIGDGAGASGTIENVTDLTGQTIQSDGYLAIHKLGTTATCVTFDTELALNFENSDNLTFLLVDGFTGANGDDIDADDDGLVDYAPWTAIVDEVALVETIGSGELIYSSTTVGPDGTYAPGHILVCDGVWQIGAFDACTHDTPGAFNGACAVSNESMDWGQLKANYR